VDPRLEHLERLRAWRGPKERNVEVAKLFRDAAREQSRLSKALGAVAEAFESIVPLVIANECTLVGLRAGVLTVETRSASCQFALDRFLRSGGEAQLRSASEASGQAITRVRVVCHHD
jgi:Dna[CI] antecedent, DciA